MRVVIAGGHGKITPRLARPLAAREDQLVGLVRNPDHVDDVLAAGADAKVLDLESTTPEALLAEPAAWTGRPGARADGRRHLGRRLRRHRARPKPSGWRRAR